MLLSNIFFKAIFHVTLFLFIIIFQFNFQIVNSLTMDNYKNGPIIEELRLKVPSDLKKTWLEAEKKIWEPWLSRQDGFLGRQIFWNAEKQEALILVNWENEELWKSISMKEVNKVQKIFEDNIKRNLNVEIYPFELIYEGELLNQE